MAHTGGATVGAHALFIVTFWSCGFLVAGVLKGNVPLASAGAAVLAACTVRVVAAARRQHRTTTTMVYAVTTERILARSATGVGFERPVRGTPVTYGRSGQLTTVWFARPRELRRLRRRPVHDGVDHFSGVADDGGRMLQALVTAGADRPFDWRVPFGRFHVPDPPG